MMTQSFVDMMYLFSCGAMGIKPVLDHDADIPEIRVQAGKQGVWHTVFLAIKDLFDGGNLSIAPEIYKYLKNKTVTEVASNTQRIFMVHNLMQKLKANNINFCVLKGEVLSYLYCNSDCRISCDTDILIDINDKDDIMRILKQSGYAIKPLSSTPYHLVTSHPVAGIVEFHLHLYEEIFEDVWFDNMVLQQDEYINFVASDGTKFPTLGITDGLIYITLHCIKHFIDHGVGIRQLMDVLLYMKNYYNEISWERYDNLMLHLRYHKFIDNIIGIGVKYLCFSKESLPAFTCDNFIIDKVLYDIECGGVFGDGEDERHWLLFQYTKERFSRFKNEEYHFYIKRWNRPNLIRTIFPSVKVLSSTFPHIVKIPALYPIACIHRIVKLLLCITKKEKTMGAFIKPAEYFNDNDIVRRRMDLIRDLDMI